MNTVHLLLNTRVYIEESSLLLLITITVVMSTDKNHLTISSIKTVCLPFTYHWILDNFIYKMFKIQLL